MHHHHLRQVTFKQSPELAFEGPGEEKDAHLGLDVIKRRRADDGEADEEDIGLRVGERSESVVIFLSSSIPQSQANRLPIDHHTRGVIVETAREDMISVQVRGHGIEG